MSEWAEEIGTFKGLWQGGYVEVDSAATSAIRRYVTNMGRLGHCLEIGCGGGFWSTQLAKASDCLTCIDIQTAEYNRFWERVKEKNVVYQRVDDPHLEFLGDDCLDMVFSYGVFCHLSPAMQEGYIKSTFRKVKKGGQALIMYADPVRYASTGLEVREGYRWHWVGKEWWCRVAREAGWTVLKEDINIDPRHPLTLLRKG